jgi:hypothetical protein
MPNDTSFFKKNLVEANDISSALLSNKKIIKARVTGPDSAGPHAGP